MITTQEHVDMFGKSCYNCNSCGVDLEPETDDAQYWCTSNPQVLMNRIAALNSHCTKWIIWENKE